MAYGHSELEIFPGVPFYGLEAKLKEFKCGEKDLPLKFGLFITPKSIIGVRRSSFLVMIFSFQ
jgi:hypothetical protein